MRSYPTVTACVHHGGTPYFSLTRFAISGWGISEALLPSSKCTHSSHVCPVLSAILASAIPATFAYASGGGAGMLVRRSAEGPAAVDPRVRCGLLRIWARAVVYDSPVFSMRARTTRLRSLLLVIVWSPLGAPRHHSPAARRGERKGRRYRVRESAPLCLPRDSGWGGVREVRRGPAPPTRLCKRALWSRAVG